jgi:hypothetical protein
MQEHLAWAAPPEHATLLEAASFSRSENLGVEPGIYAF